MSDLTATRKDDLTAAQTMSSEPHHKATHLP
jgi:hypothetical protein